MSIRNVATEETHTARQPRFEDHIEVKRRVMSRQVKILLAAIAGILVVAVVYFGFVRSRTASSTATSKDAATAASAVPISTAVVATTDIPNYLEVSGSFSPFESTDVAPQIEGQVVSTPVDEGDFVRKGQTLVRLDDRDAKLRVDSARASVSQAEAALKQAKSSLGLTGSQQLDPTRVAEVQSAQAELTLAQANERRYRALLETGDISQAQYDEFKARADTAQKAYDAALAKAKSGGAGIDMQVSSLASARAQLAIAEKALADTNITAPLDGYVQARKSAVGEWVTKTSVVAMMVQSNALKLVLQVSEADSARVALGRDVTLKVDAYPDRDFKGSVAAILPALDTNSRSLYAVVGVLNPDGALKPGMFATARVTDATPTERGIVVPAEAVVQAPTGTSLVYVIKDGKAEARVVRIGREVDGKVHIIDGLAEGETVATAGASKLADGVSVIASQG